MKDYLISPANTTNLKSVLKLLKDLNLPTEGVKEHFNDFLVMKDNSNPKESNIIGCVGLEVYNKFGLLRSLAIEPKLQSQGLGNILTDAILDYARSIELHKIYLLTTTAEKFFLKKGFMKIKRDIVPAEVKQSIEFKSLCPDSAICMEIFL
ncbi:MAG TPA: arsenic resistance N-acetyltransferase ArsN2 [candidate division Zixibacteria bacterium]|nr:arsenic resistance N-acetyltransferase ArsN2 [candidate division Zixibacteria bacterium]